MKTILCLFVITLLAFIGFINYRLCKKATDEFLNTYKDKKSRANFL